MDGNNTNIGYRRLAGVAGYLVAVLIETMVSFSGPSQALLLVIAAVLLLPIPFIPWARLLAVSCLGGAALLVS
jgi:hypothetical protein